MAEDDDQDSKTEEPSARKLEKAREEGQVAISTEIKTWLGLLGIATIVMIIAPYLMRSLVGRIRSYIEFPHLMLTDQTGLHRTVSSLIIDVLLLLAFPFAIMLILGVVSSIVQAGFVFSTKKIEPNLNKINPMSGLKRLFSSRSIIELIKGILKIGIGGYVAASLIWPMMKGVDTLIDADLETILSRLQDMVLVITVAIFAIMLFVSFLDFIYQRYDHLKKMRMTKQEVKDEHKQTEGDPAIRGRLRQIRMERARQRMMQAVPGADVVVTNPTHYAVALKYDVEKMTAPVVVAKGTDHVASRIRTLADENDITVVENPPLARALYAMVEINEEIPPEHYRTVAEVIGYVMRLKGKRIH